MEGYHEEKRIEQDEHTHHAGFARTMAPSCVAATFPEMMIMVKTMLIMGSMMPVWLALTSFSGLIMAIRAAKHYYLCKKLYQILMFCLFLGLSAGFGYIGYLYANNRHSNADLIWGVMVTQTVLLLVPVFYRHLIMLAADRGGFFLEAGILLMLLGSMFMLINDFHAVLYIGMTSMMLFSAGYTRLYHLLKS